MQSGQLNFQQQRYDDPTQSLQNAFGAGSLFAKTLDRMESQQSENEKIRMLRDKEAWDRQQEAQKMNMAIDTATREKSKFDTEQNTLRATATGANILDKAAAGQAMTAAQAASAVSPLDAAIARLAKSKKMSVDEFTNTGELQKAVEGGAFKSITGVSGTGKEDISAPSGGSMGLTAQQILAKNKGNLGVEKQLLAEAGSQFFKPTTTGSEEMLYDPSKLLSYKQGLVNAIDSRLESQAGRDFMAKEHALNRGQQERLAAMARSDAKKDKLDEVAAFSKFYQPVQVSKTIKGKDEANTARIVKGLELEKKQAIAELDKIMKPKIFGIPDVGYTNRLKDIEDKYNAQIAHAAGQKTAYGREDVWQQAANQDLYNRALKALTPGSQATPVEQLQAVKIMREIDQLGQGIKAADAAKAEKYSEKKFDLELKKELEKYKESL